VNEEIEMEQRLERTLAAVAERTTAANRWNDVAARIHDPAGPQDLDYVPVATVRRRSSRPLAALVAFMAVLAGAFGVASLGGSDGASTPEAAVRELFEAMAEEDPIGVLQAVAPSERAVLVPVLRRLADELEGHDVASGDLDLNHLAGVRSDLSGLALSVSPLSPDYAEVQVTGGRLQLAARLADLPLASSLRSVVLGDVDDPDQGEIDLRGLTLVAVHEDGGWHVGVQASLANAARDDRPELAQPDFTGAGIPERGAATAEAAAREMIDAIYRNDVRRMIELTPLDQSTTLHVWGPTLVALADASADEAGAQVDQLQLAVSDGDDGTTVVRPTAFRWRAQDGGSSTAVVLRDGCYDITARWDGSGAPTTRRSCASTQDPLTSALYGAMTLIGWGPPPALRVVEHDGAWFVSPGWSIAGLAFDTIDALDGDEALRVARTYFGDRWAEAPPEMFEACGVPRPPADASRAEGERALRRCEASLPDDYTGPFGSDTYFGLFGGFALSSADTGSAAGSATTVIENAVRTTAPRTATTGPLTTTTGP
jgi:hypothetical protein